MDAEPLPLYEVLRRCACGAEWMGKSFQPPRADEGARDGTCDTCATHWDLLMEALKRPLPEPKFADKDLELTTPPEVGEVE